MSDPITVIAIFEPKASRFEEFITLMEPMIEASNSEPGCLRYDLYEDGGGRLYLLEEYVDEGAVEAHRASAHFAAYREGSTELLAVPREVHVIRPWRATTS